MDSQRVSRFLFFTFLYSWLQTAVALPGFELADLHDLAFL